MKYVKTQGYGWYTSRYNSISTIGTLSVNSYIEYRIDARSNMLSFRVLKLQKP